MSIRNTAAARNGGNRSPSLLAENGSAAYHAYVSEQALLVDDSGEPLHNPEVEEVFGEFRGDHYDLPNSYRN
jgi:hemimethylated DNA binding protein